MHNVRAASDYIMFNEWNVQRQCAFFHYVVHLKYPLKKRRKNALSHTHIDTHTRSHTPKLWLIGGMDPITNWMICGVYISIKMPEWNHELPVYEMCIAPPSPFSLYLKLGYCFRCLLIDTFIHSFISSFDSLQIMVCVYLEYDIIISV